MQKEAIRFFIITFSLLLAVVSILAFIEGSNPCNKVAEEINKQLKERE